MDWRPIQITEITYYFDVLLTVQLSILLTVQLSILLTAQLSIFILVIIQTDAQNLFNIKFISCLYVFRAPCAHRQEIKIALYSLWYHYTYRWPSRSQVNPCTVQPLIGVKIPEAV